MATTNVIAPEAAVVSVEVKASPGAGELKSQLDELETRVRTLWKGMGCYPEIESQISFARGQLASGAVTDARQAYDRALSAISFAEASSKAEPLAWQLLGIEIVYLVLILALGYLVKRYPSFWLWAELVGNASKAAWFGALGGVTIGIYGLYTHVSAKNFDATFRLWYICKPVMGAIFGWFVFIVYYVGVISAQGSGAGPTAINNPELAFLIAFLAGFSERFTIKTIDRFMTVLTVGENPKTIQSKSPSAVPAKG
jgi:hypothetical protein